jgi:oligogalacturonide lyase
VRESAWLPPEKRVTWDARTGVEVWQLTDGPCINHAPYFLNPAWAGQRRDLLVFTSYRAGGPDLYAARLPDGALLRLTDTGDVRPWSACVSPDGRHVYYGAPRDLRVLHVETLQTDIVAAIPHGGAADACSISPDGAEIVASSFNPEGHGTGRHALLAIETRHGTVRVLHEMDQLIVHAQFSPDGRQVLFAGEMPRLWLVERDGTGAHPLRAQTRQEWLLHEAWLNDDEIIFVHWPHALKAIRRDGTGERTIAAFNCWHPAPSAGGHLIVCDTNVPDVGLQLVDPATGERRTLCYPESSCRGSRWASPIPIWDGPVVESDYGPQWTHPHPAFTPDGRGVVFTSDRTGHPQVYIAWFPKLVF